MKISVDLANTALIPNAIQTNLTRDAHATATEACAQKKSPAGIPPGFWCSKISNDLFHH